MRPAPHGDWPPTARPRTHRDNSARPTWADWRYGRARRYEDGLRTDQAMCLFKGTGWQHIGDCSGLDWALESPAPPSGAKGKPIRQRNRPTWSDWRQLRRLTYREGRYVPSIDDITTALIMAETDGRTRVKVTLEEQW